MDGLPGDEDLLMGGVTQPTNVCSSVLVLVPVMMPTFIPDMLAVLMEVNRGFLGEVASL